MPYIISSTTVRDTARMKRFQRDKSLTRTLLATAREKSPGGEDESGLSKNQIRRAQVRKAQIQHRQRKANYVKQLEMDISQLRELITQAQHDTNALKRQNDDIKSVLSENGIPSPPGLTNGAPSPSAATVLSDASAQYIDASPQNTTPGIYPPIETGDPFLMESLGLDEDLLVTLSTNKLLGTPSFSVSPSSATSSYFTSPVSDVWSRGQIQLTPAQELTIINFILS